MRRQALLVAVALLLGPAVAACGDDDGDRPEPDGEAACAEPEVDGHVTIVAEDLAWEPDCAVVPADVAVVLEVDNRDDGVNHNLHLTDAPGGPTTRLESGPVVQQLEVELPVGRYRFVCDIHPTMVGSLDAVRQTVPTGG